MWWTMSENSRPVAQGNISGSMNKELFEFKPNTDIKEDVFLFRNKYRRNQVW